MTSTRSISRIDIAYTICSRIEETLRNYLSDRLIMNKGQNWKQHIPDIKLRKRSNVSLVSAASPIEYFEELHLPDLCKIIEHDSNYQMFFSNPDFVLDDFKEAFCRVQELRNMIMHVKTSQFGAMDLADLFHYGGYFARLFDNNNEAEFKMFLVAIADRPTEYTVMLTDDVFLNSDIEVLNNLPLGDYYIDGGFVGRREDLNKILKLLRGSIHRVITICGAGGVGKTAIAHYLCKRVLADYNAPIDALIWISAKEERLTLTGIEAIEPSVKNYEDLLNTILSTFNWSDSISKTISEKESDIAKLLKTADKGILLVVDNLETIKNEQIIEFIKENIPPPHKVLITSRLGLGEVEKRIELRELSEDDSVTLIRTIAHEKNIDSLVSMNTEALAGLANRISRYPLAIKWVLGQIANGIDVKRAIEKLVSPKGDVAKFCFKQIFSDFLDDNSKKILYTLAMYEKPITRGIIAHVANLQIEDLDRCLTKLTLSSLIISTQNTLGEGVNCYLETHYSLLQLAREYILERANADNYTYNQLYKRKSTVERIVEEGDKTGHEYKFSLEDMGARTEEEKLGATWAMMGQQKYNSGDYENATIYFKRALEIAPNLTSIYRNWATVETDADNHRKAEELMRKATHLDGKDPILWFVWGNIEKKKNNLSRAKEFFNKALEITPNEGTILGALADVEKRQSNFNKAYEIFKKAINQPSEMTQTRRHKIVNYTSLADNMKRWAERDRDDKDIDGAIKKLEEGMEYAKEALNLGKDDTTSKITLCEITYMLGDIYISRGDFVQAINYLSSSIIKKPIKLRDIKRNAWIYLKIATSYLEIGNYSLAEDNYTQVKKHRNDSIMSDPKFRKQENILSSWFSAKRRNGIVRKVIPNGGYGFIICNELKTENVFFHFGEIKPSINPLDIKKIENNSVTFLPINDDRGRWVANSVFILSNE